MNLRAVGDVHRAMRHARVSPSVLALALVGLATAAAASPEPAATGVAPLDPALQGLAAEGARTPLGQELLALGGQSQGLAQALTQTTALAISPLLALTALGAWRWLSTEPAARAALPFFVQPWFLVPAALVLLLGLFKELVVSRVPLARKPLDALQLVENKVSGLLASPVAIGALAWALQRTLQGVDGQQLAGLVVGTAWAAPGPVAASPLPGALTWALALAGATATYGSVWLASHGLSVLLLVFSPVGLVDTAVRGLRLGLVAVVGLLGHWLPLVGAVLCALLVLAALATARLALQALRRPALLMFASAPIRPANVAAMRGDEMM